MWDKHNWTAPDENKSSSSLPMEAAAAVVSIYLFGGEYLAFPRSFPVSKNPIFLTGVRLLCYWSKTLSETNTNKLTPLFHPDYTFIFYEKQSLASLRFLLSLVWLISAFSYPLPPQQNLMNL